jgi:hypothetical protein
MTATYNTNEKAKLVNNTTFDTRSIAGAEAAFIDMIDNDAALPEEFEDVFTLEVFTRPSGSKYGILRFA